MNRNIRFVGMFVFYFSKFEKFKPCKHKVPIRKANNHICMGNGGVPNHPGHSISVIQSS